MKPAHFSPYLPPTTGTLKWSYATGSPIDSSPVVVNGVVYTGLQDGRVYAFHLHNMRS